MGAYRPPYDFHFLGVRRICSRASAMRVLINEDPFPLDVAKIEWNGAGQWPCHWISAPELPKTPFVCAYRLAFEAEEAAEVRIHVTADERYLLFLDGEEIGRGSDRGDANNWFFESYDILLEKGPHLLVAQVRSLGDKAPLAQLPAEHGFLLCPQEEAWQAKIGTGHAAWESKIVEGLEWIHPLSGWGTGWNQVLDARKVAWDTLAGEGEGWLPTITGLKGMSPGVNDRTPIHILKPSMLPPMLLDPIETGIVVRHVSAPPGGSTHAIPMREADDLVAEHVGWMRLFEGDALVVPANTRRRILLDIGNYVCAFPQLRTTGGHDASVRIHWQESLYTTETGHDKGNRDEIEGKYFNTTWHNEDGIGDRFISDGQPRTFNTLWWQAGRYVEVLVETADEPLTITRLDFIETHYPYEFTAEFEASDLRLTDIMPIMRRVLEMCSHETYMDCPYYEQLQYIGDTRLQVLVTYTQTDDDRLPRKALTMFDASRRLNGLTQSRYPSNILQIIPPFSLWYVDMLHDFALWRGDFDFLRPLMIGARGVLDAYRAVIDTDGLLGAVDGWNFVDWVPGWYAGMPKDAAHGKSGILNLHLIYTLRLAAELEEWLDEPEMAARHRRTADRLAQAVNDRFWSEERGLYANDLEQTQFSEHAQCLALLGDAVPSDRHERVFHGLLNQELDRTTIYFSHYLFETYRLLGRPDLILDRMPLWFDHVANGLKTTIESPEPTRSDCHAWGAHPLYHYFATFLGIRPTAPGFTEVEITPQLGPLRFASGTMPTPHGDIVVRAEGGDLTVHLPVGVKLRTT